MKILNDILRKTALENNKKYIGKSVEILVESAKIKKGRHNPDIFACHGKTRHYKTVQFESNKNLAGQLVKVEIIEALPWGLIG